MPQSHWQSGTAIIGGHVPQHFFEGGQHFGSAHRPSTIQKNRRHCLRSSKIGNIRRVLDIFSILFGRWQQRCAGISLLELPAQLVPFRSTTGDDRDSAYSKRVPRTNCALRIKKCAPRISSGIYFLSTS